MCRRCGIVAKPGVVATAVEPDVTDLGGGDCRRLNGAADDGLVDVAKTDLVVTQKSECVRNLPGRVAQFDDEWVIPKATSAR